MEDSCYKITFAVKIDELKKKIKNLVSLEIEIQTLNIYSNFCTVFNPIKNYTFTQTENFTENINRIKYRRSYL